MNTIEYMPFLSHFSHLSHVFPYFALDFWMKTAPSHESCAVGGSDAREHLAAGGQQGTYPGLEAPCNRKRAMW